MKLARRMSKVQPSAIRELLKLTERPDVLSFAGGLPAPEAFPREALARAHAQALEDPAALQYGTTEGYGPLRDWIARRMTARGLPATQGQVLVTAGSQQGIDLTAKALLDPGDVVLVENPSYLAALQCFSTYEAQFAVVGSDEHGMRVDEVEARLQRDPVKLIYLVPTFQNPRGTTLSLERRHALARLSAKYGVAVLEDDPYGELRYSGRALPPLAGLNSAAHVIHLGSFSKTLAPGLRLGWAVASEEMVRALTIAKQATDLHTGLVSQRAVATLLETFDYDAHLRRVCALYGERLQAMLAALERHFPPGTTWTVPEGGLFVWVELPGGLDAEQLLAAAMAEKVAFVPGAPFFAVGARKNSLRLNFSNRPPELITQGLATLAQCVDEQLRRRPAAELQAQP